LLSRDKDKNEESRDGNGQPSVIPPNTFTTVRAPANIICLQGWLGKILQSQS